MYAEWVNWSNYIAENHLNMVFKSLNGSGRGLGKKYPVEENH